MLPNDVLVEIFNYYLSVDRPWYTSQNTWHALVHVCRRWRYLVFASPRRLNLRLAYGGHRSMSEVLDLWPVLPVKLISPPRELSPHPNSDEQWDNKVAALESEHYNRICEIYINDMTDSRWERFAAAMQKPFSELTHLDVSLDRVSGDVVLVLPDSFLGGSAPRLRELRLSSIPFPSMPKLLLSANGLVTLTLEDIPNSGYISPDAMAIALTVMTRLESLRLEFRSPRPHPDPASRPPPPPTRFVLPALTKLMFGGVYEYLEDLLSRIDAPLIYDLRIVFFMDFSFNLPQLHRLIGHAEVFKTFDHAEVSIMYRHSISLNLYPKRGAVDFLPRLELQIICKVLDWQLSSLAQICTSPFFPLISALEELKITSSDFLSPTRWKDDTENAQWLELLNPFTALKNLYLSHRIAQRVCGALRKLSGERATEVLPALRNVFVDEYRAFKHIQEAIRSFVAARPHSGYPVVVHHCPRWTPSDSESSDPELSGSESSDSESSGSEFED